MRSRLNKVDGLPKVQGHEETSTTFTSKFINDYKKVHQKVITNPFLSSKFCKLNKTFIFTGVTAEDQSVVFKVGRKQYNNFSHSRFIYGKDSLDSKISKNQLKLKIVIQYKMKTPALVLQNNF